jgi:hypothetical protein
MSLSFQVKLVRVFICEYPMALHKYPMMERFTWFLSFNFVDSQLVTYYTFQVYKVIFYFIYFHSAHTNILSLHFYLTVVFIQLGEPTQKGKVLR